MFLFLLFRLIQKFSDEIHVNIMGYSETVPVNTLTHGALINFKLHTEVQRILQQVCLSIYLSGKTDNYPSCIL